MVSLPEKISVESERGSGVLQGNFKQPYTFAEMVAEYALPSFPYGSQSKERLAKGMGIELEQLEPWYAPAVAGVFLSTSHYLLGYNDMRERQDFTQLVVLNDYADPQTVISVIEGLGLHTEILYKSEKDTEFYKSVTVRGKQKILIPNFSVVKCSVSVIPLVLERGMELGRIKF